VIAVEEEVAEITCRFNKNFLQAGRNKYMEWMIDGLCGCGAGVLPL
jgi:hypothetical protein